MTMSSDLVLQHSSVHAIHHRKLPENRVFTPISGEFQRKESVFRGKAISCLFFLIPFPGSFFVDVEGLFRTPNRIICPLHQVTSLFPENRVFSIGYFQSISGIFFMCQTSYIIIGLLFLTALPQKTGYLLLFQGIFNAKRVFRVLLFFNDFAALRRSYYSNFEWNYWSHYISGLPFVTDFTQKGRYLPLSGVFSTTMGISGIFLSFEFGETLLYVIHSPFLRQKSSCPPGNTVSWEWHTLQQ